MDHLQKIDITQQSQYDSQSTVSYKMLREKIVKLILEKEQFFLTNIGNKFVFNDILFKIDGNKNLWYVAVCKNKIRNESKVFEYEVHNGSNYVVNVLDLYMAKIFFNI